MELFLGLATSKSFFDRSHSVAMHIFVKSGHNGRRGEYPTKPRSAILIETLWVEGGAVRTSTDWQLRSHAGVACLKLPMLEVEGMIKELQVNVKI